MKNVVKLLICCLLISSLSGCAGPIDEIVYDIPEEGVWYCEELEVHLNLGRTSVSVLPSYAIINGEQVTCIYSGEYNTPYMFLCCQESGIPGYKVGDIIYWWTFIEQVDDTLILEDYETGERIYFIKVS